jgi:hypothetical protein
MRGPLIALFGLVALLAPARAAAAPLGELPPAALGGVGSCLHSTGAAGELLRDTDAPTPQGTPIDLLRAGRGGFASAGSTLLAGASSTCSAVAGRPDGAAVLAAIATTDAGRAEIVAADRPAGGAFAAPVPIARSGAQVGEIVTALSPRGGAVVAWQETSRSGSRIRAVVRPAGGAFGAPVVVASGGSLLGLVAGISAGGDAVLAWADPAGLQSFPPRERVLASIAPAGRGFARAQVLGTARYRDGPELAVADDGRALLALPLPGPVRVVERPPDGTFGRPVRLAGSGADEVAITLGTGGRAAVVWSSDATGRAGMATRAVPGAFGRPVTLFGGLRGHAPGAAIAITQSFGGAGDTGDFGAFEDKAVASTLTPDGVLAAWLAPRLVGGLATTGVRTAFVPAVGGPVQRSLLGGGLRDAENVVTFPAADGGPAAAWLELDPARHALLHAALAGATRPPDPPAPGVTVGTPRRSRLTYSEPLGLPVSCSAACDVHVGAPDGSADGALSLPGAGHEVLLVFPRGAPLAPRGGGRVRLRLLYGAPGAAHPAARDVSVRLRLRPPSPRPHPYDVRARRLRGDRIRVTWATDVASPDAVFVVTGTARRGGPPRALTGRVGTLHRRRFAVTLKHAQDVRLVTLETFWVFSRRRIVVRVR